MPWVKQQRASMEHRRARFTPRRPAPPAQRRPLRRRHPVRSMPVRRDRRIRNRPGLQVPHRVRPRPPPQPRLRPPALRLWMPLALVRHTAMTTTMTTATTMTMTTATMTTATTTAMMTTTMMMMMTMTTTMMTTKPSKTSAPRPTAAWSKQVISFGASFAFFGLAGFLQNGAFFESSVASAAELESVDAPVASAEPTVQTVVTAGEKSTLDSQAEWLGPVQLLPTVPAEDAAPAPAPAPAPAAAPAPAPAPVEVDGHTGGS